MKRHLITIVVLLALTVITCFGGENDSANTVSLSSRIAEVFRSGGIVMWVMLFTSIIGLTYGMERFMFLRKKNHLPEGLTSQVNILLENEGYEAAQKFLKKSTSALARVISGVLLRYDGSREEMERGLDDDLARVLWDERRNIRPVGIVASLAPLMGLLGTVIGMIEAFRMAAEEGMDNPANFAGGIYQALYTTAFGLMISIPFLVGYQYLRGRAELIMRMVEDESLEYIHKFYEAVATCEENKSTDSEAA